MDPTARGRLAPHLVKVGRAVVHTIYNGSTARDAWPHIW